MQKIPLIGISSTPKPEDNLEFVRFGYSTGLEKAGGIPVILSIPHEPSYDTESLVSRLDGLILSGGHDVDPNLYGEKPVKIWGELAVDRDAFELELLKAAIALDKPVLAICRGMQLLNIMNGGTLIQDIETEGGFSVKHIDMDMKRVLTHPVTIEEGSALAGILGQTQIPVTTVHHQGIREVAPGFSVVAQSEDGMIEAIESPEYPDIVAVQWHPELMVLEDDPASIRLFIWMVEAALQRMR